MCYFTRRSLEQASSEATADYKANRIAGTKLLNLSGGLGIDDWAFAQQGMLVISLDPDEALNELVMANQALMDVKGIERRNEKAEAFITELGAEHFDWIYADPDRREEGKRRVGLDDCAPAIKSIWPEIQKHSNQQLIKLSPLYPLEQLEKELLGLERIEVVALNGEVKEVLAYAKSGAQNEMVPRMAVEISGNVSYSGVPSPARSELLQDEGYFYEIHPSLSKSNLGGTYAREFGLKSLIPNGIYLVDDRPHPDFFGRGFEVIAKGVYSRRSFQQYLKEQKIIKANLASRYFKLSPEELKKIHKISDGGEVYFFFYTAANGLLNFVHGKKLAYNS